jgi:hypothetical protein
MTKRIPIDIKNASGTVNAQKPQNTPVTIVITGRAPGLGPFTATGTHVWVFAPGGYADLNGMLTLTNARGWQLDGNYSLTFTSPTGMPPFSGKGAITFTGGTRGFAGATGHAALTAVDPNNLAFTISARGSIRVDASCPPATMASSTSGHLTEQESVC